MDFFNKNYCILGTLQSNHILLYLQVTFLFSEMFLHTLLKSHDSLTIVMLLKESEREFSYSYEKQIMNIKRINLMKDVRFFYYHYYHLYQFNNFWSLKTSESHEGKQKNKNALILVSLTVTNALFLFFIRAKMYLIDW